MPFLTLPQTKIIIAKMSHETKTEFCEKVKKHLPNIPPESPVERQKMLDLAFMLTVLEMYPTEDLDALAAEDEAYVCYCMECDEPIEGMTEEEFNDDSEVKLCAACEAAAE